MTFRISYRDKRRPQLGLCLMRVEADSLSRAAGLAKIRLAQKGIHPTITAITADRHN